MSNDYTWWQNALKGEKQAVHDGDPKAGFYRVRNGKDGPWVPVAIWQDDAGQWVAVRNGKTVSALDIWTWVCRYPVTHESYQAAVDGKGWPDDAPVVAPAPGAGSNLPEDPFERLKLQIEAEKAEVETFLKTPITDQTTADQAASWSVRIAGLAKDAEDLRVAEKKPFDNLANAVQAKWKPLVDLGNSLKTKLKNHLTPFLVEQERQRVAAQRAEEEKRRAEEAERAGVDATPAPTSAAPAKVANATAGRHGAKVALQTVKVAVIADYDKALMALKDHREMKELVQQLANRAAKAGIPLDGVTISEEKKAA